MAEVERIIDAPVERVWAVLADGWSYSDWVVGNTHVRDVEDGWPEQGTRLYHSIGAWPVIIPDITMVAESRAGESLVLKPQLRRLGRGTVAVRLSAVNPDRTRARIRETFDEGPMRWAMVKANDLVLHRRNAEALRRLSDLAVRHLRERQPLAGTPG